MRTYSQQREESLEEVFDKISILCRHPSWVTRILSFVIVPLTRRSPRGLLRRASRRRWGSALAVLVALLTLTDGLGAQPLKAGLGGTEERRILLDQGTVRLYDRDFHALEPSDSTKNIQALFQGTQGWTESFLAVSPQGLARLSSLDLSPQFEAAGEAWEVASWGEDFLAHQEGSPELLAISSTNQLTLKASRTIRRLWVVNPDLAVLELEEGFQTVSRQSGRPQVRAVRLPFPASAARLSMAGGQAVIWSLEATTLVEIGRQRDAVRQLPEAPSVGCRVLSDGSVVSAGSTSLVHFAPRLSTREFPKPTALDPSVFEESLWLSEGNGFSLIIEEDGRPRVFHYPRNAPVSSDLLPVGRVRAVLQPETGKFGHPLLFQETSLEEPKYDAEGRAILDLVLGTPTARTVQGHRIFVLANGKWSLVHEDPRAALVGPMENHENVALYATQTEPERRAGHPLSVDARYPYPAVLLHGRSLALPSQEWVLDRPRGEAPSKNRLPEDRWPLLDHRTLLLTSEGNQLLAVAVQSGELRWSSPPLPLDDSSPLMLYWPDKLGLQATQNTGRALLVLSLQDGSVLHQVTLSEFFFRDKWSHLLAVALLCTALAVYIYAAGRRDLYIRRIAGLQALDEAVGRATEMGKPVLYVVGLADVDDIQTMASLSILSHVARKTAEYDTPIITTTARAVAFSAAQEIVRDAFSVAGRPDAFSVESVRYISDDQFGYTAGVDGIMVREKPAANFYIGNFYAESLILAETGHATGSIQIAGTAQPSQVPFFVAACDYTLIGEELFAASAYLSRDPLQVGSLRGQDVGKAIVMLLLVVCSVLVTLGVDWATFANWMGGTQ